MVLRIRFVSVVISTESTALFRYGYSFVAVKVKVSSRVLMFPSTSSRQDPRENKTNYFPRDLTLSVLSV